MAASETGKTRAIIAHITIIGWIVALVMNNENKDEYASYYIRQMLGIILVAVGLSIVGTILVFIPFVGILLPLISIVLWIVSLVYAVSGEKKPLPVVGDMFQDWFKSL